MQYKKRIIEILDKYIEIQKKQTKK